MIAQLELCLLRKDSRLFYDDNIVKSDGKHGFRMKSLAKGQVGVEDPLPEVPIFFLLH
jgi:hypothetical protein